NDPLEHEAEADRIADAVVADRPVTDFSAAPPRLQLKCAGCAEKDEEALQRKDTGPAPAEVPPIVHRLLRQSGRPLDATERAYLEPRFGCDFGSIRVHADATAAKHGAGTTENTMTGDTSRGASWDFSKIPLFSPDRANRGSSPQSGIIQRKLVVGQPNDPLE